MSLSEAEQLRQTKMRFESELERSLGADFASMPRPLTQLIDAIECEPPLAAHFARAVDELVPSEFDAIREVERVTAEANAVFGPFEADQTSAAAQAYLIVKELVNRRTKLHDPVFTGYEDTDQNPYGRFSSFVDGVVMPMVNEAQRHLSSLMEPYEAELAAGKQAGTAGESAASEVGAQDDAPSREEQVKAAMADLRATAYNLPAQDCGDALMQIDALQDELLCDEPKPRVVRVLIRTLRSFDGGTAYKVALDRLSASL